MNEDSSSIINELRRLWYKWVRGRERSAKPLCVGSIPTRASIIERLIKTTEKFYNPWVKKRLDRLDGLVMGAWD